eukprot:4840019-Ditylum_brightwellii.AAC.1
MSPDRDTATQVGTQLFTQANKQLQFLEKTVNNQEAEWEKKTKAQAKEREESKRDTSGALEKLNE